MCASDIAVKLLLLIGERQNCTDEKHARFTRDPRINLMLEERTNTGCLYKTLVLKFLCYDPKSQITLALSTSTPFKSLRSYDYFGSSRPIESFGDLILSRDPGGWESVI